MIDHDLNPNLPVIGSLVVFKSDALDLAYTNVGRHVLSGYKCTCPISTTCLCPCDQCHHVLSGYKCTCPISTTCLCPCDQVVMSLDEQNPLRLQVYRKSIGVEDALIEKPDIDGMNGCIHVINKALNPVNTSAGDILRQDGNFSIFLTAMEKVMEKNPQTLELQKPGSSYTFFVPTDQAFNKLGSARLHRIMGDSTYLTKTIKNHLVEDMFASEGFRSDLFYDVQTRQNVVDVVKKNGKLKVNDATMTRCDLLNTNGVIHVINKVLLPDHHIED
uniref:FAS1 domain-containing protein n=1 Tax=Timema poppense TaxID=170557 RepID=A0A7R9HAI0_TIMPO|nr:unnamed protein product [Timema poppensis]